MSIEFSPIEGRTDIISSMAEANEAQKPKKAKIGETKSPKPGIEDGISRYRRFVDIKNEIDQKKGPNEGMFGSFSVGKKDSGDSSGEEHVEYLYENDQGVRVFRQESGPVAITGNSETTPDLFSAKKINSLLKKSGVDSKIDFPKNWEELSISDRNKWLKENDADVFLLPPIEGGAMEPPDEGTENGEEVDSSASGESQPIGVLTAEQLAELTRPTLYDYDSRVRVVIVRLINLTRDNMRNGTQYKNSEDYIRYRAELQTYINKFNSSLVEGHFKDVNDFVEVIKETEYFATNSSEYSNNDQELDRAALEDIFSATEREAFKNARDQMDIRYSEIFRRMSTSTIGLVFKNWQADLEPQIQGVKSGWNQSSNVWADYFGGRVQEYELNANGDRVPTTIRYSDGKMSRVSSDIEESQGGREMVGITEWRLFKQLSGAREQVLTDLVKKPPAQWEEIPERLSNIYREIERSDLEVNTLQGYIQQAIHMIESVPGETGEGRERIDFLTKELKAFQAFHTLRITMDRGAMSPEAAEEVYKKNFDDETWRYFLGRYAQDSRRRDFQTQNGVNLNLFNETWNLYMNRIQTEKKDMVLVEYMTLVDIKKKISGAGDSRLGEIETFVNRPQDLSARAGKMEIGDRWQRMEDLRVQVLSEGAISDVKLLMARLEGLKIRNKIGSLSPAEFQRLKEALEEKDMGGKFGLTEWEKARIEYFRLKTDEEIDTEIRGVISAHGSFDDLGAITRLDEGWQKEALRKAHGVADIWGGAAKTKEVVDDWYRKRTFMGAYDEDDYGRSLVKIRRQELQESLRAVLVDRGLKIDGDGRDTQTIINELQENGYLEGLDSTTFQMIGIYAMADFDMIRIYGTHFKTGKVSRHPQAITFNQASKNIGGRMVHHMMDFLVDEQRGRSYEEDEINGIFRKYLPGFYDNLLPGNRTMVRFHKNFMSDDQGAIVEERAIDLMRQYRLIPGLEWESRLNEEADQMTIKTPGYKRDPYFDGLLGWARAAVIAEMIDGGDTSQMDFTGRKATEVFANKLNQFTMIDLADDQRASTAYYSRPNLQEWLKDPTRENFMKVNDGKDVFYSGRNIRIWAWMMIATRIQLEIMQKHQKRLGLERENASTAESEDMVDSLEGRGLIGEKHAELIRNDEFGMKPKALRGVPGAQILGTRPFRVTRQVLEFVGSGLWETFKPWSFYYPKQLWDLIRRIFAYAVSDFTGK